MQIAERRKLVSSIKSGIINPENNDVSYEDQESSFPNADSNVGCDNDEDYNGSVLNGDHLHSNADKVSVALSSATSRDFGEGKKKLGKNLSLENPSSGLESPKQLKETRLETIWSDALPLFLSKSVETASPKEEKLEDFVGLSSQEVNNEATVSMEEDIKPPPLAGTNVMNIILVAAECAPWSKTGV